MGDEYGIFNLRAPVIGSVESLMDRPYLYEQVYGNRRELPAAYSLPFASRSGRPFIGPNTVFIGNTDPQVQFASTSPRPPAQTTAPAPAPAPTQVGPMPTETMLGNSQAVTPFNYGSYGQSGFDYNQLLSFLTQDSMTPLQKRVSEMTVGQQALLGGGLGLLGIGAGALLGRGQDDEFRKSIRETEDTTDEFEMLMDQARRMAPTRADIIGMRGPGISGMQASEAAEAGRSRAMRDAYSTYGQVNQQAKAQAQQMRAQLEAMRDARRQQAIQGVGSVIGTAAGMLFPGVGNIAGAAIGAGLSRI